MPRQHALMAFLAAALLLGTALASTVTLTGSCNGIVRNNTVQFSLANSGNGTALNVIVNPYIADAEVVGNYSLSDLVPNSSYNFSIRLTNVTAKGSYGDYFIVAYQQGTGFFSALFPCMMYFGNTSATSQLSVISSFSARNSSFGVVTVNLSNEKATNVTANVMLLVPPMVSVVGQAQRQVFLSAYKQSELRFYVNTTRAPGVSFAGAAVAWYQRGGVNFSTLSVFSGYQYVAKRNTGTIIIIASIVVLALVASLAVRAFLKGKSKK
ncbi:MAG: CARDB domain-containing protein [Candidatus Micrarchaeaceae archaeon]